MTISRPSAGVGVLLFEPGGGLLLGHRIKAGESPSWCMPGGHLEAGETFEEAALREVAEEAGVSACQPRAFVTALAPAVGVTIGVTARATTREAEVREPEIFDRWQYFDPDHLPDRLFPASAALLAAWRGQPAPPGWHLYPLAGAQAIAR